MTLQPGMDTGNISPGFLVQYDLTELNTLVYTQHWHNFLCVPT